MQSEGGLKLRLKKSKMKKPKKTEKLDEIVIKTESAEIDESYEDISFDPNFDIKQEMPDEISDEELNLIPEGLNPDILIKEEWDSPEEEMSEENMYLPLPDNFQDYQDPLTA